LKKAFQQPASSSVSEGTDPRPDQAIQDYVESILAESFFLEGIGGSSSALVVSADYQRNGGPVLWICPNNQTAQQVAGNLSFFLPSREDEAVLLIPGVESDPYSGLSPHPYLSSRRATTLWKLATGHKGIVVTSLLSLVTRIPARKEFLKRCIHIELGASISRDQTIAKLRALGYVREDPVGEVGGFSFRGGIVDIFSPALDNPVRMEFFGDEIESIREFDPSSQRSIRLLESCEIVPMREAVVAIDDIENWNKTAPSYWDSVTFKEDLDEKLHFTRHGELFTGFEYLFPLVVDHSASLLDFFADPEEVRLFVSEPADLEKVLDKRLVELQEAYDNCLKEGTLALPPGQLIFNQSWLQTVMQRRNTHFIETLSSQPEKGVSLEFRQSEAYRGRIQSLLSDIQGWLERGEQIVLVMPSDGMTERMAEILDEYGVELMICRNGFEEALQHRLSTITGKISQGFYAPELRLHVLTHDEIFSRPEVRKEVRRPAPRSKRERFRSDFRDLQIGDYVVHIDHGIGVFLGLKNLGVEADDREFVTLEYRDGAKLYVPIDRLDLIQKYAAGGDAKPRIDRLGGASWTKTKRRIRKSMRKLAESLLKLYARREVATGYSFPQDDELLTEFEKAFEYEETPDQISAIAETKRDMESKQPMDRLVCGDVGYGKTEVAMRAAFKAVNGGKQVALMAPTTVLAFQHLNTFSTRFQGFPITVSMLSRFLRRNQQKEVLKSVSLGMTDILIGTHRVLSKDVQFKDLGLIIIDEEQRFGVAQKEKLKDLKAQVDVLTLSATPIPRTLNMSLIGIRDLSIIETPPRDRLAIQTVVTKFSRKTIRSAIDLELKRSGQAFFVHNSIETIYSIAEMVQMTVPEARVAVAHGQMKESELEKIMLDFLEYRFDVLVCTTIIENGLDIPRANTILVNRADHFGLSQLYQLRGRVGRSDRRAYAYLLVPFEEILSSTARKRLAAIKDFSELGSGFRLAAMDLEIRGAGNLLGGEQHGHIRTVGYELYTKLLEQTIRELKGEQVPKEIRTSIDLRMDIQIPEHYVEDPNLRLWLYKRISAAADETSIEQFRDEMTDRFGHHPRSVSNLLDYAKIRLRSQQLKITSLERKSSEVILKFREDTPLVAERVISLAQDRKDLTFSPQGDLILSTPFSDPDALFNHLNELLDKMS
jgi:transcription-repair coupling factor (superfamily II helicase)